MLAMVGGGGIRPVPGGGIITFGGGILGGGI